MNKHLDYFIRSGTDWVFRRRSPALTLARIGASLLTAVLAISISLKVTIARGTDFFNGEYSSAEGPSEIIAWIVTAVGLGLLIGGVIWEVLRQRRADAERRSRRVVVIESRGLRDFSGDALFDAVPTEIEGVRDSIVIDTRENVIDGEIHHPAEALRRIESISDNLSSRESPGGRANQTIVYGGISPVPFAFLLGVILDDEGGIVTMDWDRNSERWRQLDGADDGERFSTHNLDGVLGGETDVVLAVSVSYSVNQAGIRQKFPTEPIVELSVPHPSTNGHWSEAKQAALTQQFLEVVSQLDARGVGRIHLILACQNSVAFRLGRRYDKRNLPPITVYQYERHKVPPYPWGVTMPVSGRRSAALVEDGS